MARLLKVVVALCICGALQVGGADRARADADGPGVARWVPADSLARVAGTVKIQSVVADTAVSDTTWVKTTGADPAGTPARVRPAYESARRVEPARRRPPRIWWTTLRSGLVPGWGQWANGRKFKAGILVGLDAYWLVGVIKYESERKAAERVGDVAGVNTAVDRRNFRIWMMGATAIYAMLDAYVDAHFYDYDEGWSGRIGLDAAGQPEARLAYRF